MSLRAITRVQFELSGGWRNNAIILLSYFGFVIAKSAIVLQSAGPNDVREMRGVLLALVSVGQGLFVLIIAPSALHRAVQRDLQTAMLDSHRLTPLSGLQIVAGYLTGAPLQALLLYGGGLLAGGWISFAAGRMWGLGPQTAGVWYFGQGCVLPLSFLLSTFVLLVALCTRARFNVTILVAILGVIGGWFVVWLVPGLGLLFGVFTAGLVISTIAGTARMGSPSVAGWSLLLQLAFALTLAAAACRKVRAPDRPPFSIGLGLLFVGLTATTLLVGLQYFDEFTPMFFDGGSQWPPIASLAALLLAVLVPLTTAACERVELVAAGGASKTKDKVALDSLPLVLAASATFVFLTTMPAWSWASENLWPELSVFAVVIATLTLSVWTDYQWACWARARRISVLNVLLVVWGVLKLAPITIDVFVAGIREAVGDTPAPLGVAGCSPFGLLAELTFLDQFDSYIGFARPSILAQLGIAIASTLFARRAMRRMLVATRSKAEPAGAGQNSGGRR